MPLPIVPLILGGALATSWGSVQRDDRPLYTPGTWVWPVPRWRPPGVPVAATKGYAPVVSQEYKPGTHNGVDIMFRRASKDDRPEFRAGTHDGSIQHFAPPGVLVLAASDGIIWSCDQHPQGKGWQIVIDHGRPFATYYLHMVSVRFPIISRGQDSHHVRAGDVLGVMGYNPMDPEGLRHLHFEVWYNGAGNATTDPQVNPAPLGGVQTWTIVDLQGAQP